MHGFGKATGDEPALFDCRGSVVSATGPFCSVFEDKFVLGQSDVAEGVALTAEVDEWEITLTRW